MKLKRRLRYKICLGQAFTPNINYNINMIKKVPFSSLLVFSILVLSLITGSYFREINQHLISIYAFNSQLFSPYTAYTVLTMIPFTLNPLSLLGMMIISIGCFIYEYKFGTLKVVFMFIATHLSAILVILTLAFFNLQIARNTDIGASIGFWGVSGAVLGYVRYKKVIFSILILFSIFYLLFQPNNLATIEHPISLFLGMLFQKILTTYEKRKK